jgi:hypothetical protein
VFLSRAASAALLTGWLRWALVRMDAQAESLRQRSRSGSRAERRERQTKEKQELALASSEQGFWELDPPPANPPRRALGAMFGNPLPRLPLEQALRRVHPEDRTGWPASCGGP